MHGRISARTGLFALFALAFVARVALIALAFDARALPYAYEHGPIAENLLAGRGFSIKLLGADGPTSQQAPFYPLLLAASYKLFGIASPASFLSVQFLQALVGAFTALLLVSICWKLLPARRDVGWWAGVVAALSPAQIYAVTHLQVVIWATFAIVLAFWLAIATRSAAWPGLAAGLLLLIEPIFLLAIPFIAWLRIRESAGWSNRLRVVSLFFFCVAITIAPWLWRNARVHGEFVFIKSTFGYAFWQGNNRLSLGTDKLPDPNNAQPGEVEDVGNLANVHQAMARARLSMLYIDDVALSRAELARLGALSEPARSRWLFRQAIAELTPARYAELCARRLSYFLLFDATNPKAAHPVYRMATLVWLALLALGAVALRRDLSRLWPLAAIALAVTLFHALTITAPRFRLPIELLTYLWCGAGLAALAHLARQFAGSRVPAKPRETARRVVFRQRSKKQPVAATNS